MSIEFRISVCILLIVIIYLKDRTKLTEEVALCCKKACPPSADLLMIWGGFVCLRPVRSEVSGTSGDLLILVVLLGAMFLYGCFVVGAIWFFFDFRRTGGRRGRRGGRRGRSLWLQSRRWRCSRSARRRCLLTGSRCQSLSPNL